jgi:hypothetical protein
MITNEDIINILLRIESRLDKIEAIIKENKEAANKMSDHIDFIDNVYDNVKKPFCKILSIYNGGKINIDKNLIKNEI